MAVFSDNLNKLLNNLQETEELDDLIFVSAFEKRKMTRPVAYPMCSVGIKTTQVQSDVYAYETFLLKVYSPLAHGGSACHEYLNRIGEYILKKISGVVSVVSNSIEYNPNAMAFTSELTVKCRNFDISVSDEPTDDPVSVSIDGKSFDAYYINSYENSNFHAIREMWNSTPIDFVAGDKLHVIEIKLFPIDVLFNIGDIDNFSITFNNLMYKGCHFTDIVYDLARNRVEKAQIYAREKQVVFG